MVGAGPWARRLGPILHTPTGTLVEEIYHVYVCTHNLQTCSVPKFRYFDSTYIPVGQWVPDLGPEYSDLFYTQLMGTRFEKIQDADGMCTQVTQRKFQYFDCPYSYVGPCGRIFGTDTRPCPTHTRAHCPTKVDLRYSCTNYEYSMCRNFGILTYI
jgi:hypothetical protein